mgnify:FL=1
MSPVKLRAALITLCVLAYGATLAARGFIRDDRWIIAENPLMRQGWRAVPALLTTGYWEAAMGPAAPIQEYRPLLSLTFLLQRQMTGLSKAPMHAVNLILHILVCLLLWEALRRRMKAFAAAAAAAIFAVLPVHAEAVCALTGRSELLSAALILGAWLQFEQRRLAAGCALFSAALLTKEHAFLFPVLLALSDWVFHGRLPWHRDARRTYGALAACAVAGLTLRWLFLSAAFHGGVAYFTTGRLIAALTYARFALRHYLWPSLTGADLCADFSRPLIPDEAASSLAGWACLLALAVLAALAVRALSRRRPWAFWALAPLVFLLPTFHLVMPLDTLGAERLLYLPSIGLAALLGLLWQRWRARAATTATLALAATLCWYTWATIQRSQAWGSEGAYYEAAISCNPVSSRARSGLGVALARSGRTQEARGRLLEAIGLDAALSPPYYNLAHLAWSEGDDAEARRRLRQALERDTSVSDSWVLLAVIEQTGGRLAEARAALERALILQPMNAAAEFNLGRLCLLDGRAAEAPAHFARFVALAPDDPDAPVARGLAAGATEAR